MAANECKSCGHPAHLTGTSCPAIGRTCNSSGKLDNFSPKCPSRDRRKSNAGGTGNSGGGGGAGSSNSGGGVKSKVGHITIGNVQVNHQQHKSPNIAVDILDEKRLVIAVVEEAIPDPGAEVSVVGRHVDSFRDN